MAVMPTIFTVHAGPSERGEPLRLAPHRFSWAGFWFGPLWLLASRMWGAAAITLALAAALVAAVRFGALSGAAGELIWLLISVLIGLEGQEWRRRALVRRRAPIAGFAYGADEADALAYAAFRLGARGIERTAP